MLAACLAGNSEFAAKFRLWESRANLDTLDSGAVRLIPYLKTRLAHTGLETELSQKINGIYRFFWAKRRLQDHAIEQNLIPLIGTDQIVALKGLALEELAYSKDEPRPFDDLDVLVSRAAYFEIVGRAREFGFDYVEPTPESSYRYLRHAMPFRGKNLDLDLHWTILPLGLDSDYDQRLMLRSMESQSGKPWLIPSPTDTLLHTVIHGNRRNSVSPIRWYLDAHLLLNRNVIDWELLWHEAGNMGLTRELASGLDQLSRFSSTPIERRHRKRRRQRVLSPGSLPARVAYSSESLFVRRVMRLLGSDFPLVRRALARDGLNTSFFSVVSKVVLESLLEIKVAMQRNSMTAVLRGDWSKPKSRP